MHNHCSTRFFWNQTTKEGFKLLRQSHKLDSIAEKSFYVIFVMFEYHSFSDYQLASIHLVTTSVFICKLIMDGGRFVGFLAKNQSFLAAAHHTVLEDHAMTGIEPGTPTGKKCISILWAISLAFVSELFSKNQVNSFSHIFTSVPPLIYSPFCLYGFRNK